MLLEGGQKLSFFWAVKNTFHTRISPYIVSMDMYIYITKIMWILLLFGLTDPSPVVSVCSR